MLLLCEGCKIFDSLQLLAIARKYEDATKYASYEATVQPTLKRGFRWHCFDRHTLTNEILVNGIETCKSYLNEFVGEKEQFFKK